VYCSSSVSEKSVSGIGIANEVESKLTSFDGKKIDAGWDLQAPIKTFGMWLKTPSNVRIKTREF